MFNKLLEKGELKFTFTDKRKNYYMQNGGNLGNIFKAILPHAINFGKNYYQHYLLLELRQRVLI